MASRTLLLADDSVTIQRVVELTFADEDIQVVAVGDGDQAIARLEASPPDIVLADIGMPGRNGYEVARYIKQSPRLAHIPVVLLSGAFEPVDQLRASEAGCDGVLAKPFEPHLVIERVKELLARPCPSPVAPSPPPAHVEALDSYFERLDAALSKFSIEAAAEPAPASASWLTATPPWNEIDGFTAETIGAGEPDIAARLDEPPPPAAQPAAVVRTLPSLADAFAALLEAEKSGGLPILEPRWPVSGTSLSLTADEIVSAVTRRVLDHLSDRVVREAVADLVPSIAQRLVREELERIKASIQ